MSREIMSFKRKFQIQTYVASHSQLLLRSAKSKEYDTRIDILFKDVYGQYLGTFLQDLSVFEVSRTELETQWKDLSAFDQWGIKWFLLKTSKWDGFVCAAGVVSKEDRGEFHESSQLLPGLLHPGVLHPERVE